MSTASIAASMATTLDSSPDLTSHGSSISLLAAKREVAAADLVTPPSSFPSSVIRRRLFEARRALPLHQKNKDGISASDRLAICASQSWAVVSNTCMELEGAYIEYWKRTWGRPVFPVGILMPQLPLTPVDDPCLEWLNRQAPRSVVMVAFGSESTLANEDVVALALGLEDSLIPFILVLPSKTAAALPLGFSDRTHGRGVVVTGWVPQLQILSHPSTGAFLTQCGWNSVLEGLRFGVPLVALPMQYDQGLNARLIADELEVAVEVRRNEEDGSFAKEDISKAVRAVMVEGQGAHIKANIARLSEAFSRNDYEIQRSNLEYFIAMLKKEAIKKHSS